MRDPSTYTLVGLGANASDETVFLKRRVSYVTAIIQSAFGHLPEGHQDGAEVFRKRVWDKLCPTPALPHVSPSKRNEQNPRCKSQRLVVIFCSG